VLILSMLKGIARKVLLALNSRIPLIGVDDRRRQLSYDFDAIFDSTIRYGHFAGLKMLPLEQVWWNSLDRAGILFGQYEREVTDLIYRLSNSSNGVFIDVGAADGIYAVGVLKNKLFERVIAFEQSLKGQRNIADLANQNNVDGQLEVRGAANSQSLLQINSQIMEGAVMLIDIEGAEYSLMSPEVIQLLRKTNVIIELHFQPEDKSWEEVESWVKKFEKNFNVDFFTTGPRDTASFDELRFYRDSDRWLICSEGRRCRPMWLHLSPRSNSAK